MSEKEVERLRQAEAALRASEDKWRAWMDQASNGIVVIDFNGNYIEANHAASELLGFTRDELLRSDFKDTAPAEHLAAILPRLDELQSGGGVTTIRWLRRPNGPLVPLEISARRVGESRILAIIRDVSERVVAEHRLRESETRLRTLASHAPVVLFSLDRDGRFSLSEGKGLERLGLKPGEVVGQSAFELYADNPQIVANLRRALSGDAFDAIVKVGDVWYETRHEPVRNSDGEVTGVIGVSTDITERKQIEEELRESKRALTDLLRNLPGMAYRRRNDREWTMEFVSEGCQALTGYAQSDFVGNRGVSYAQIIHPDDQPRVRASVQSAIRDQRVYRVMYRIQTAVGEERWVWEQGSAVLAKDGEVSALEGFITDITDRKRAEDRLSDSESSYRFLFQGNPHPMWVFDLETLAFIAVNDAAIAHYGFSREEFLAMTIKDIRPEEDVPKVLQHMSRLGGGVESAGLWRHKRKDGSIIEVEIVGHTLMFENRRARLILANDVTERRHAERELQAAQELLKNSEEHFRLLIENSSDIITIIDEAGVVRYASPSTERVLGYRPEELVGTSALTHVHPDDLNVAQKILGTLLQGPGLLRSLELRSRHRNGEWRVLEAVGSHVRHESGTSGVLINARDITQRKQIEETHERLATAVEQAAESVVITDHTGRIVYCNPTFARVSGYSREEAIGKTTNIVKSGRHSHEFYQELWNTITRGDVWRGHFTNKRKDGTLFEEEATISPIRRASGEITNFVAVKRDVTHEMTLQTQLYQSQKLEAVGVLAGGVAHDFNNILTAIIGYSEFLHDALGEDSPLRKDAEEIKNAADRATALTRQLLAFSRKQVLRPRIIDLNSVVLNLGKMLRRLIGEHIELETMADEVLGAVEADPGQIEQVVMNLVVNARDAMPRGGRITIKTENIDVDATYAADRVGLNPGLYALLAVSDTGLGMDAETRAHIFEPFFTTKEQGKGTGLGLSTVYGIVKQSGGHISVYSEVGRGSVFRVYLPRVDDSKAHAVRDEGRTTDARPRGTETVLLVEDDNTIRSLTQRVLEHHGYTVLSAQDSAEALGLAASHRGAVDLLLTDVIMPNGSGKELALKLKSARPDIAVLYMSGYTEGIIASHGVLDPNTRFLQKPFTMEDLLDSVRGALDVSKT